MQYYLLKWFFKNIYSRVYVNLRVKLDNDLNGKIKNESIAIWMVLAWPGVSGHPQSENWVLPRNHLMLRLEGRYQPREWAPTHPRRARKSLTSGSSPFPQHLHASQSRPLDKPKWAKLATYSIYQNNPPIF